MLSALVVHDYVFNVPNTTSVVDELLLHKQSRTGHQFMLIRVLHDYCVIVAIFLVF